MFIKFCVSVDHFLDLIASVFPVLVPLSIRYQAPSTLRGFWFGHINPCTNFLRNLFLGGVWLQVFLLPRSDCYEFIICFRTGDIKHFLLPYTIRTSDHAICFLRPALAAGAPAVVSIFPPYRLCSVHPLVICFYYCVYILLPPLCLLQFSFLTSYYLFFDGACVIQSH